MPVDATPVDGAGCVTQLPQYPGSPTPRLLAVSCSNRNVFTTQNSEESTTGAVVLSRVKSVRLPSNQLAILQHTMHTEQGVPVNVSDCLCLSDGSSSIADSSSAAACAYAIKFTLQESLSFELTCPIVDVTAEVVDGDKGLSLTEKLSAAFHRLTYKTLVHRIRLRGRFPLKLIAVPEDPFAGDPVIAERLRAGKLPHAGHNAAARTCDFNDPQAPPQWRDWAHGFSWLRDLAADTPREEGARIAEPIVARWLAAHGEFDELAWRPDLIGTRILFWTAYAPYILSSTDHVYRSAVLNALARWARHLDRAVEKMPDGMRRLQAIAGLIVAGLDRKSVV